jgi:predicted dehydrogenase
MVDLCTPTPLHPEQAIASLRAGKFVFCEKPLARTSAAGQEVLQAEAASGRFLMPAMCMRFWPGWSWLKQAVEQQTYGKVLAARFGRLSEMPFWSKQGTYTGGNDLGGALFDLHIHDVDFVQFLFGKPERVFASGVIGAGGSIDHVVAQYIYPGGPAVAAEGGWLMAKGFNMFYTIHCERATLDFDLGRGTDALRVVETGKEPRVVPPESADGYAHETAYVVDCVRRGIRPTTVTARDAVVDLQICEAEEKSVKSGQVVAV